MNTIRELLIATITVILVLALIGLIVIVHEIDTALMDQAAVTLHQRLVI